MTDQCHNVVPTWDGSERTWDGSEPVLDRSEPVLDRSDCYRTRLRPGGLPQLPPTGHADFGVQNRLETKPRAKSTRQ